MAKRRRPPGADLLEKVLRKASDAPRNVNRVRTGIFTLDLSLRGGLPVGRISVVYGPEGSGKSSLLLRAVGDAQRRCASCWRLATKCECEETVPVSVAWIDTEGVWSTDWAERLGVDTDALVLAQPEFGEQAVDVVTALIRNAAAHVIILDSVAAVVPFAELDSSANDELPGLQARLMNRALRVWVSAASAVAQEVGWSPTLWLTNQVRMKIGTTYGNPETMPGGLGIRFAPSLIIRTSGGSSKSSVGMADESPVSVKLGFRVAKSKVSPVGAVGEYVMAIAPFSRYEAGEVVQDASILAWLASQGAVNKSGSVYEFAGRRFRGRDRLFDWWHESGHLPRLYESIMQSVETGGEFVFEASDVEE